jgi:hypothetical protein
LHQWCTNPGQPISPPPPPRLAPRRTAFAAARQLVFSEASRRSGRTIDKVISIMDAQGLSFGSLTGYAQKVGVRL